jgi:hypothetical protein
VVATFFSCTGTAALTGGERHVGGAWEDDGGGSARAGRRRRDVGSGGPAIGLKAKATGLYVGKRKIGRSGTWDDNK